MTRVGAMSAAALSLLLGAALLGFAQQDHQSEKKKPGPRAQPRRQALVMQQQQRLTQYRQELDRQQPILQQQTVRLQQQKRTTQYRVHLQYVDRLRQQQIFLQNDRHPDYERDPYFYTAPMYRYSRGGHDYETNQDGAELLRQGANFGYQEGVRAGDADRRDRWPANDRESYAYQDATYGFNGYYVDRADYSYYFREGFRRGYEDGYGSRSQYGRHTYGTYGLLDAVSTQVLGFQSVR
jgi:hypothetical protein